MGVHIELIPRDLLGKWRYCDNCSRYFYDAFYDRLCTDCLSEEWEDCSHLVVVKEAPEPAEEDSNGP